MKQNRYMVISTIDADGPWSAAVAFTAVAPNRLFFISLVSTRHAKAVALDSRVSGVIFNSTVNPAEAESVQFSGLCEAVEDDSRVMEFLQLSATRHNSEMPTQQQVEELNGQSPKRLFQINIQEMFVLDQEAWQKRQEDLRQSVNLEGVLNSI